MSVAEVLKNSGVTLATRHGKLAAIAPAFERFGITVTASDILDTDQLGTFSGDIERPGTQEQTLEMKIERAHQLLPRAKAIVVSEGAFYPHPESPFITLNTEMVMLHHFESGLKIIGTHTAADVFCIKEELSNQTDVAEVLQRANFPLYGVILKQENGFGTIVRKDFVHAKAVIDNATELLANSNTVMLETDMRAHRNPTRMEKIKLAAENLVEKLMSACPACNYPGFAVTKAEPGLPCELCGTETRILLKHIKQCKHCGFEESILYPAGKTTASAVYCDYCNP